MLVVSTVSTHDHEMTVKRCVYSRTNNLFIDGRSDGNKHGRGRMSLLSDVESSVDTSKLFTSLDLPFALSKEKYCPRNTVVYVVYLYK